VHDAVFGARTASKCMMQYLMHVLEPKSMMRVLSPI
jgi:hypothetical protein